ncbi:MAG: FAD-dependent oxidoreductase [Leptospiraceae bacterium]|nr:FAD-dependent oxidoreductase [Leptospiraceae bacterium]
MQAQAHYDYLIIGADAAGNSAAGQIRRRHKEATIGILEKGAIISYGACGLPYAVSGKIDSIDKLIHFTPEAFGGRTKADVLVGHEAIGLNTDAKKVQVQTEHGALEIGYGKLLIATGAAPIRLPFIDYAHPGVFELKTVPDGRAIKSYVASGKVKRAGIIGAGYIGLEAAETFREMGLAVTVIEALDRAMPRLLESQSNQIANQMQKEGVEFLTGVRAEAMHSDGDGIVLTTSAGELQFDLLLVAVGMRPNTSFLDSSGLALDKGAVVINQKGETSLADVYSGGDCALVHHALLGKAVYYPLGHTANKQGRIAGVNMASPPEQQLEFAGVTGTQVFKFFDTAYAATGLSAAEAAANGFEPVEVSALRPSKAGYYPGSGKAKMSLVFDQKSQQLLGAFYSGPLDSYAMIDAASALIYKKATASEIAWMDFAYAPPFAPVWNALISAAGKLLGDE